MSGRQLTGRIRDSPSPSTLRNRLVHSMASALSRHSISAQPPTSSLASVKGPSTTVNLPPFSETMAPSEVGEMPPVATMTPALVASSTNLPISSYSSGRGGSVGVSASLARVYPRNRIVLLRFLLSVKRRSPHSDRASSGQLQNRQPRQGICGGVIRRSPSERRSLPSRDELLWAAGVLVARARAYAFGGR